MEEEFKNLQIVGYEEAVGQCSCVLPGDLIVEILPRLPVKSLLRFESASKPWQVVIRSSKFIAKHLIHHQEHKKKKKKKGEFNHLHVYSYDVPYRYGVPAGCKTKHNVLTLCYCPLVTKNTFPRISLISNREDGNVITSALSHSPYEVLLQSVSVVGSSNGLVCIQFYITCCTDPRGTFFAIWNPATRKITRLPHSQHVPSVVGKEWNIIVGFSYIPSTSNYKLVRILVVKANNARFVASVQVLNMGENIWREVEFQGQDEAVGRRVEFLESTRGNYVHNQPLVVDGCLHWLGILQHGGVCMVSFDLDKEVFTQTALPYPFDHHVKFMTTRQRLAVFEDNLAAFVCPDSMLINATEDQEFCFEVWVYDITGKSWTKRFSFGPLSGHEHPVGFFGNDEVVIRKPFMCVSKPYLYNLNNKEKRDFSCCSDWNCNFAFEPYVESLVEI